MFKRNKKMKDPFGISPFWLIAILLGFLGAASFNPIPVRGLGMAFGLVGAGFVVLVKAAIDLLPPRFKGEKNKPAGGTGKDDLVTVAYFWDRVDAELAKSKLESEGIETLLLGDHPFKTQLTDRLRLQVKKSAEEKAARALKIN